jgi:hypothetical protein
MALLYRIFTGVTCSTLSTNVLYSLTSAGPEPTIGGVYSDGSTYYSITNVGGSTNSYSGPTVDTNTNYGVCPGLTARPFAYNPTQLFIPGTYNIGTLCVGVDQLDYYNHPGGLTWWGGPNENQGYCIGTVVPSQNQSTPLGNIGNVKFWRTKIFTDASFINLANQATGLTFTDTSSACAYLASHNYWTSFNNVSVQYFVIANRTSAAHYWPQQLSGYYRPNTTPSYVVYSKPSALHNRALWTELGHNYVGSPAKYTYGGAGPQYTYGGQGVGKKHGLWLTDVWVYSNGTSWVFAFPNGGTATYGTGAYISIVNPFIL